MDRQLTACNSHAHLGTPLTWLVLIPANLSCSLCSMLCCRYVSWQVVEPQRLAASSAPGRTCKEGTVGTQHHQGLHTTAVTPDPVMSTDCHAGPTQGGTHLSRWRWWDRLPQWNSQGLPLDVVCAEQASIYVCTYGRGELSHYMHACSYTCVCVCVCTYLP